jgi:hypothetical protein
MPTSPIRFCFGLHLHQPVGNFGYVFEQHVRDVYLPFLARLRERDFFPVAFHVSGPLLEWLEENDRRFLDALADLTSQGKVELLLAGFYEPVLASLPRRDRLEQIAWLRETLATRFGVKAHGLWLTERVWEPDLAADLFDAGVRFALVDDRHFLVSGFGHEQLHAPFWTEHVGKRVALFPIDEKLRYLIPFQPPEDTAAYLRSLRERGHGLAVLADDGEKFGGWPGTREWVYDRGWLDHFLSVMGGCLASGEVMLSTFDAALMNVPSGGIAYLSTASYREMEAWSLPVEGALRLAALERDLGPDRLTGGDGVLVRGSHWRNFLVKYAEANRMHKKMLALSRLCRERGDPAAARRAIGRAQCNDAYWHGVFGGLYLPFLRAAVWENLARAEGILRQDEALSCEEVDIDYDGQTELWVHSHAFSAIVSPARGGAVEELTWFAQGTNIANALTRRREAYHITAQGEDRTAASDAGSTARANSVRIHTSSAGSSEVHTKDSAAAVGAPSIHELEHGFQVDELPPVDLDDRAIFIERVLATNVSPAAYERATYVPAASGSTLAMSYSVDASTDRLRIVVRSPDGHLEKELTFSPYGAVRARFAWDPAAFGATEWFTTELSLDREHDLVTIGNPRMWSHPIETIAKSERGLDRTLQGFSYLILWPIALGRGEVEIPLA